MLESKETSRNYLSSFVSRTSHHFATSVPAVMCLQAERPTERWAPARDWGHGWGLAAQEPAQAPPQFMPQTELCCCVQTQHPTVLSPWSRNQVQVFAVETWSAWTSFLQERHCTLPSPGEMTWQSWGGCWSSQSWKSPLDWPCSLDGQSTGWALNCSEKSLWWCNTCQCPFFQNITSSWSPAPSQLVRNHCFEAQSLVRAAVQSGFVGVAGSGTRSPAVGGRRVQLPGRSRSSLGACRVL